MLSANAERQLAAVVVPSAVFVGKNEGVKNNFCTQIV